MFDERFHVNIYSYIMPKALYTLRHDINVYFFFCICQRSKCITFSPYKHSGSVWNSRFERRTFVISSLRRTKKKKKRNSVVNAPFRVAGGKSEKFDFPKSPNIFFCFFGRVESVVSPWTFRVFLLFFFFQSRNLQRASVIKSPFVITA